VSESEVKAELKGTNGFAMPSFGFPKFALPGVFGELSEQGVAYGLKVIEISNANTASAIDFFVHLLGSKSATDVVTVSAEQARKAFDTASAQNKDLWELAQKLATATGEPLRNHVAKVLHQGN
jgi:hypothetical protein